MCGIAGYISNKFSKCDLIKMTDVIKHRGPDSEGHYFNLEKRVGLGHSRLSIIDISSSANQPMKSSCGKYVMVYNGEVYNFKDIAKELDSISWKTSSDSEVVLEAFAKWGVEFVNKLNGMFAIAIYDLIDDKLFLFRDRLGIKPLYYYNDENTFAFGSELKALKKLDLNKSIDYSSIYSYLHLGYIPSNNTIFSNVKKLSSGSYIIFDNNKNLQEIKYWDSSNIFSKDTISDFDYAKNKLDTLLKDSVKKRLISDVPIGTFLSGGTDSSIVTAIAQKVSSKPVNTFSIGFKEAKYNESEHAKKVAEYLGTNHREFILTKDDALCELESIMDNFDEPFADSSALPTMLVSKMARKHVTVCLSGDGGDELFMGYGAYNWASRLSKPLFWNLRKPLSKVLSYSNNQRKRAGLLFNSPKINWKSHIFSQEQYFFSETEINNLLLKPNSNSIIHDINILKSGRELSKIEQQSFFDLNNYLKDDLLVKVDRSSMYCSLEARVPLLDHNIVEFALNVDDNLKIKNGVQKYLLKELLYDYIPKSIMDKPKWGFSIPLDSWLQNELYFMIDKYLNESVIIEIGLLDPTFVKELISNFKNGRTYLYNRIWNLIILNKFLSK